MHEVVAVSSQESWDFFIKKLKIKNTRQGEMHEEVVAGETISSRKSRDVF